MVSAIVLTHNDEQLLGRTLGSLSWCNEIVIIDDASTDKTREIAGKFTSKIFIHPLHDDFAAQRNFGLTKAKGPASTRVSSSTRLDLAERARGGEWVLFVDSDEVVSQGLAKEIQNITQNSSSFDGYYLKRRDWMFGKALQHGETANVRLLRMAKKDAGAWTRPVHEVWNVQGEVGELQHPLEHFPHSNVAQFINEINRYSTLNAKYLYSQGARAAWWHIIAYPKAKFFSDYIWLLGFLDGTAGAIVALLMSFHSFLTRAKLWLLWHANKKI